MKLEPRLIEIVELFYRNYIEAEIILQLKKIRVSMAMKI